MWRENQMKIGIGPVENLRLQGKVREAEGKRHGWNVSIRTWNLKACVKVLLRIKKHGGVDCWDRSDLALGWKNRLLMIMMMMMIHIYIYIEREREKERERERAGDARERETVTGREREIDHHNHLKSVFSSLKPGQT